MAEPSPFLEKRFTYADYAAWPDDERWELIDGKAWDMSPAPSYRHQGILWKLIRVFDSFFKDRKEACYCAPADVLLPGPAETLAAEVSTVVQPDILVVSDASKLSDRYCLGAPDLVVEILSPHTARKDMKEKFEVYERSGVREYWVVDPGNRVIHIWTLGADGKYGAERLYGTAEAATEAASAIFPGLIVPAIDIFPLS